MERMPSNGAEIATVLSRRLSRTIIVPVIQISLEDVGSNDTTHATALFRPLASSGPADLPPQRMKSSTPVILAVQLLPAVLLADLLVDAQFGSQPAVVSCDADYA